MSDAIKITDEYRSFWNQSNLLGVEDYGSKAVGEAAQEAKMMVERLGEEFSQGASVDAEFLCLVGMKNS